jgi:hypothetical protein
LLFNGVVVVGMVGMVSDLLQKGKKSDFSHHFWIHEGPNFGQQVPRLA